MSDTENDRTDASSEAPDTAQGASLSPKLLERLICPVSRGPLNYDKDANKLVSQRAKLAFPIKDGIPILIEDEAEPI